MQDSKLESEENPILIATEVTHYGVCQLWLPTIADGTELPWSEPDFTRNFPAYSKLQTMI